MHFRSQNDPPPYAVSTYDQNIELETIVEHIYGTGTSYIKLFKYSGLV